MIDLLGSEMTIAEVATKHGFSSVRAYKETFPRYYGVSPAEYRRRHQKETVLYQDLIGEEVTLDDLHIEVGERYAVHSGQGCSILVALPEGRYEVLSVESGKGNASNRIVKLNGRNKSISIDSDCEELILRIRKHGQYQAEERQNDERICKWKNLWCIR